MALVVTALRDRIIALALGSDPTAAADAWLDTLRDWFKDATAGGVPVTAAALTAAATAARTGVRALFVAQTAQFAIEGAVLGLWDPTRQAPPPAPTAYFAGSTALAVPNATTPNLSTQILTAGIANTVGSASKTAAATTIAGVIYGWSILDTSIAVTFPGPGVVPLV